MWYNSYKGDDFLFFDFGGMQTYEVIVEAYVGNQQIIQQQLSTPQFVLEQQFISLLQQAKQSGQPMRVIMRRYEDRWNQFEQKMIKVEYKIEAKTWEDEEDDIS